MWMASKCQIPFYLYDMLLNVAALYYFWIITLKTVLDAYIYIFIRQNLIFTIFL